MKHAVILSLRASADLEAAALWIARDSPGRALSWFDRISGHILKLADFPLRWPVAPESREFSAEIRQAHFGRGRGFCRVLFAIEGESIHVLPVRHGMRATMESAEIERLAWPDYRGTSGARE